MKVITEKTKNFISQIKNEIKNKTLFTRLKKQKVFNKLAIYFLLIGISYVFLFPILNILFVSFMSLKDLIDPEVIWLTKSINLNNFAVADRVLNLFPASFRTEGLNIFQRIFGIFSDPGNLYRTIRNMSILAIIQTTIAALTGFAFARYNFKFKKFWFAMLLVSFVIPISMVTMTRVEILSVFQEKVWFPFYDGVIEGTFLTSIFQRTVFNSLVPQIFFALLGQGINSVILILIFYNFFKMIPKSIDEAAKIDGANSFQIFYNIYVKLVVPIVIVVFLFSFIWNWNDSFTAGVFYSTDNPIVISRLALFDSEFASQGSQQQNINEGFKTAATFLTILPLMIIYLFAQKRFIEGIERTGLTGE